MREVKQLSERVDRHIKSHNVVNKKPLTIYTKEAVMANEIECLKEMQKIYKKDIKSLKDKLNVNFDTSDLIKLEEAIAERNKEQNKLLREKKLLQSKIDMVSKKSKKLELVKRDNKKFNDEEKMLKLIENECAKTKELETRLSQAYEVSNVRKKMIAQHEKAIESLSERVNSLKGKMKIEKAYTTTDEAAKIRKDTELLHKQLNKILKFNKNQITQLELQLSELKEQYQDINKVALY